MTEYRSNEVVFNESRLALVFILMIIPFYAGVELMFQLLWKGKMPLIPVIVPTWVKIGSVVVAIAVHELIHGLFFAMFAKNGIKSVKFGFSTSMGSPYCHCSDPIKVSQYKLAGIAPFVILGILPLIFAMISGVNWIKIFGLLLSIGGFGDVLVWWKLSKLDKHTWVRDHPTKMGFIIEQEATR